MIFSIDENLNDPLFREELGFKENSGRYHRKKKRINNFYSSICYDLCLYIHRSGYMSFSNYLTMDIVLIDMCF
jgi:hypothetical protein